MDQTNAINNEPLDAFEVVPLRTNDSSQDRPPNWPLCNPSYVLEMLHALKPEKCFELKAYYTTYSKSWDKLVSDRRMKTLIFFGKQSVGVKTAIRDGAMALEQQHSSEESKRAENTTKDDRCR